MQDGQNNDFMQKCNAVADLHKLCGNALIFHPSNHHINLL